MNPFKTFALIAPLTFFSQNTVVQTNISFLNNGTSLINTEANVSPQTNRTFRNYVNTRATQSQSQSRATNGTNDLTPVAQSRRANPTPVTTARPRTNVRRYRSVTPEVQTQQAVVVAPTTISNPVNEKVTPQINTLDNNYGENNRGNVYVANDDVKNVPSPVLPNKVSPVQAQSSSKTENNDNGGFSLPKFNFGGGKNKISSASSKSIKKHLLKKFFMKKARKFAAKHGGGNKKKFSLDGCFSWFTGK